MGVGSVRDRTPPIQASRLPFTIHHISTLNPELYYDYDRARFIEMLVQWGWMGPGPPPAWYLDA